MSPDEADFVDRMGLWLEMAGGTRTMGRIYGRLMVCDPPHQSLAQLAEALGVSKASVSTVARQLQEVGMIERRPSSERRHEYRITAGGFTRVLQLQAARMQPGIAAAEFGLSAVGADRSVQREHLEELRDFLEFCIRDFGADFVSRWESFRDGRRGNGG
ncbi:MarR family transcriptional regulator [Pseudonocardia sp. CNS-139]|nr:MarR family transcriptional regulator [Pseudonocardia sp. CNS-139]